MFTTHSSSLPISVALLSSIHVPSRGGREGGEEGGGATCLPFCHMPYLHHISALPFSSISALWEEGGGEEREERREKRRKEEREEGRET